MDVHSPKNGINRYWPIAKSVTSLGLEDPGVKYHHRVKKTRLMRDIVPCDCSVEAQGPRAVKDQHLGGRKKTLMKHLDPFGEYQRHSYPPKRGFAVGFWHSARMVPKRHLPGDHLYVKLQKIKDPRHGNSVNMCVAPGLSQRNSCGVLKANGFGFWSVEISAFQLRWFQGSAIAVLTSPCFVAPLFPFCLRLLCLVGSFCR